MDIHHPGTNQMLPLYVNNLDSNQLQVSLWHLVSDSVMQTFYMYMQMLGQSTVGYLVGAVD